MRELIKEKIKQLNISQKQFAVSANISPSALSKYLNGSSELSATNAMNVANTFFAENRSQVLEDYFRNQTNLNARIGVEYCSSNGLYDTRKTLIEKLLNSGNEEDREWGSVYSLVQKRYLQESTHDKLNEEIRSLHLKYDETKILAQILELYAYYDKNHFDVVIENSKKILGIISGFTNDYIKETYTVRIAQVMAHVYFYLNNINDCRHNCEIVINGSNDNLILASTYHTYGHSFLFEDFEKSEYYLKRSLQYYEKVGNLNYIKLYRNSMNFLYNYYKKVPPYLDINSQEKDVLYAKVYYFIQQGEFFKARELLEQQNPENLYSKGFHYFYCGILDETNDSLFYSIRYFNLEKQLFYAQLPRYELKSRGVPQSILLATTMEGEL